MRWGFQDAHLFHDPVYLVLYPTLPIERILVDIFSQMLIGVVWETTYNSVTYGTTVCLVYQVVCGNLLGPSDNEPIADSELPDFPSGNVSALAESWNVTAQMQEES